MKKTRKVKKKVVKFKKKIKKKVVKKKTVKKKTVKKKVVKKKKKKKKVIKKKSRKKTIKKKKRKKRKKKVTMEEIYKVLNQAQISKKEIAFTTLPDEAFTVENIIRDAEIGYDKIEMKTQTVFTIYPKQEDNYIDILEVDYLDDEIPEEGQIFG